MLRCVIKTNPKSDLVKLSQLESYVLFEMIHDKHDDYGQRRIQIGMLSYTSNGRIIVWLSDNTDVEGGGWDKLSTYKNRLVRILQPHETLTLNNSEED